MVNDYQSYALTTRLQIPLIYGIDSVHGHGNVYGAIFIGKFPAAGADSDKFGAPVFDTSGGGTSNIQYSTDAIDKAKSVGGHAIKGVREY